MSESDLELIRSAVVAAGAVVMKYYRPGDTVAGEVREKGADNPLTQADLEADTLLRSTLLAARPDYGWLSEETADTRERLERRRVFVVDPIDGTKEFIIGLPQFAISVGLVEDGEPVAACVLNPASGELFTAERGGGTRLNGQPVRVTAREQLSGSGCLASRSETMRGEWERFGDRFTLEMVGSIAYKTALVACGRFDLTFTLVPKSEWDFCAGALLIHEAGGRVTDKEGQPFKFNRPNPVIRSVLATNGVLHPELLELLRDVPLAEGRRGG